MKEQYAESRKQPLQFIPPLILTRTSTSMCNASAPCSFAYKNFSTVILRLSRESMDISCTARWSWRISGQVFWMHTMYWSREVLHVIAKFSCAPLVTLARVSPCSAPRLRNQLVLAQANSPATVSTPSGCGDHARDLTFSTSSPTSAFVLRTMSSVCSSIVKPDWNWTYQSNFFLRGNLLMSDSEIGWSYLSFDESRMTAACLLSYLFAPCSTSENLIFPTQIEQSIEFSEDPPQFETTLQESKSTTMFFKESPTGLNH